MHFSKLARTGSNPEENFTVAYVSLRECVCKVPEWTELVMSLIGLTANQISDCEQNSLPLSSTHLIAHYRPLNLCSPSSMQTEPDNLARDIVVCACVCVCIYFFTARWYNHR